jgi:hypothetical protein
VLADELDYVVGVDTHRDQHTLAVVAAPSGGVVAECSVRASAHAVTRKRFALPTGTRLACVFGRLKVLVITALGSLAS